MQNAFNVLDIDLDRERDYCVAFSGGLDSTVLLHEVAQRLPRQWLRAVHVHHGLSSRADQWQAHCQQVCAELGIELTLCPVQVKARGQGLEAAAREARYRAFESVLRPGETLLMAHHADDQVETLLLRLTRGSGPTGLAGMAPRRALGQGSLWRPFLSVSRAVLESRARTLQLRWVDDDSNTDTRFDRNYLRHDVVPALRRRWPNLAEAWTQSARWCAESDELLRDYAREDLRCLRLSGADPHSGEALSVSRLSQLPASRRRWVIRTWLRDAGLPPLSRERLLELDRQLMVENGGRRGSADRIDWPGGSLRRFRDGLYRLPCELDDASEPENGVRVGLRLKEQREAAKLPNGDRLILERVAKGPRLRADLPELSIGYRQGGERCQPVGRDHSQALKKLLQEYAVPPWWRQRLPLIYSEGTLVAVADLWICRGYEAEPGQPGYRLLWRPRGRGSAAPPASFD